jgi:hypothetical protein
MEDLYGVPVFDSYRFFRFCIDRLCTGVFCQGLASEVLETPRRLTGPAAQLGGLGEFGLDLANQPAVPGQAEQFLDAHGAPPPQIILDLDATDDPLHGHQEGRFFHGYYDNYCYLPLYIFCGRHLLAAKLRPANIDGSAGSDLPATGAQSERLAWSLPARIAITGS